MSFFKNEIMNLSFIYEINLYFLIKFLIIIILILFIKGNFLSENTINNIYLKNHLIVSLTTSKNNMKNLLVDKLVKSILRQTLVPFKILISINEKNRKYISNFIHILIKKKFIEIIYINEDLRNFNKYYYIPNIYKQNIIIVINDNIILEKNAIKNLFKSFKLHPNSVSARRVYKMNFSKQWNLQPFYSWDKDYNKQKFSKFSLFAIHGEGTLFPPNTLNITYDFISYFKEIIEGDDFIIKYYELNINLKTVYVNNINKYSPLNKEIYEKYNKIISVSPNEYQLKEDFKTKFNYNTYNYIIKNKVVISNEIKQYYLNNINTKNITNETLLISMTSYPLRINWIFEVFISLLYQSANISSYQCFLTLAKEEFINREKDLPLNLQKLISNGWIKLIWHHNIFSHKKLMPILEKYPDNDILIVDDDIIRTYNFIEIFQKDHRIYPNDIICGIFMFYFDNKIEMKNLHGYNSGKFGIFNAIPNIIFQTSRPTNGFGGVLYPKHTFTDKRFFNETLYMKLCPTSDESWQYTFNIIENKILRQTSIIIDNSINVVEDSQINKLYNINKNYYPLINDNLIKLFPEYKINSINRQKKILISLTSYKERFKTLNLVLDSIFNNTMKPSKIVLSLYKDDILFITKYMKEMINNKSIELIITNLDLKSHNKYYHVMKKYRDYAIITIDDDKIYRNDLIENLYNNYLKYPNYIHARNVQKILINNNKVLPYKKWLKDYTFEINPSFYLFPLSGAGMLFPPNILNISEENINEIYKYIRCEDIYLKYISHKKNIKIVWAPNKITSGFEFLNNNISQIDGLYKNKIKSAKLYDECMHILNIL